MALLKIDEIFNFEKGVLQSSKCVPGEYDFITASSDWKTHNEYTHDCEALIFAAAASGSLGRTHYVNGKFISSDLCFIITPKDQENLPVDLKFYHILFNELKDEIVRNTKAGTSKEAIGLGSFGKYQLPYFDIDTQIEIKKRFVNAEELKSDLSSELNLQVDLVKKLRQQLLQDAVQGKLLPSTPPLKEGCPQDGEVVNQISPQDGEVVNQTNKSINNLPYLKTFRKELRNNLTPAEAKLWTLLKGKQLGGKKFRRQFSVANYILDFYCPSENLAIELDGQGHFEATQAEYDAERDLFLQHCGIKVLRFENKWVWDNPEGLLDEVKNCFGWCNDPSVLRTAPLKGEQREEAASELLKKIKAEKEKLIAEKKLKKEKELPPIKPEEIPFEIPENWVWCRLGEIAEIGTGATPLTSNSEYYENGKIPWITSSATNNLFVDEPELYITEKALKETNCKVYPVGTLVVAMYGQGKTRGQITELNFPAATNQACATITLFLNELTLRKYVKLFFQKIYNEIRELAQGGAQPNLNMGKIRDTIIPLPPLSEQTRIVQKLDELMNYCNELEASIKQSQEQNEKLLQQVLREALRKEPVESN
ncbi:MAG: restriction endonuclease subunit S [Bacteroidetes bacterium]|nr:restriction endonuclease subunit S [Bacteroidota bacterium]